MSSSSGCRSELSFPCKSLQTVVTHTSVSVFSDCSFSGIPGMRPACTTSSFRQGMDKEKGSCLSHSARSSPSSSSHFDFSSYSVANDEVGLNIHGWDSHDESVLYWMLCFYGSACRSDPPFQNEVKVAGTRQPFAAVCMLVRTEAVAVATASILTLSSNLRAMLSQVHQIPEQCWICCSCRHSLLAGSSMRRLQTVEQHVLHSDRHACRVVMY